MAKRLSIDGKFGSTELKRVSATLAWTVPNFLSLVEAQRKPAREQSPPFSIKFGQAERKFLLQLDFWSSNDDIAVFLHSANRDKLLVEFHLKLVDKNGCPFSSCINKNELSEFTEGSLRWGRHDFISFHELKENANDWLDAGSLKVECDLTISDAEVSYEGPRLTEDLKKLRKEKIVSDFKIICQGETFPCHKAILASR